MVARGALLDRRGTRWPGAVAVVGVALATGCQLVFSTSAEPPIDAESPIDAEPVDAEPLIDADPRMGERLIAADFAHGLHLTANFIYFSESRFTTSMNKVGRIDRVSGEATIFGTMEGAAPNIYTFDDDTIYWTTWDPRQIRAFVVSTGQPTTVATAGSPTFALAPVPSNQTLLAFSTSSDLYELPGSNPPSSLVPTRSLGATGTFTSAVVIDDTLVYTVQGETATDGVYSIPRTAGASPTQIVEDPKNAWGLVVTEEFIIYGRRGVAAGPGLSELVRVPRSGGKAVTLARDRTEIRGIAVDGNGDVYFAEFVPRGSIWKVPIDGSTTPMRVIENQSSPMYVAVTDSEIYWTNFAPSSDGGGVYRAPK